MPADLPSVSVVIPAYGRPERLSIAIESALSQTLKPMEIIVVDDCSPVGLSDVAARFGPSVRCERLPENKGANAARNRGVELAAGELVAFLDDDDVWLPEKLERQVKLLHSVPGAEACLCGWQNHNDTETRVHPVDAVRPDLLRRGNVFCGMSGMVARRDVLLSERLDEDLPNGHDWDIYIRLSKRVPIPYVPAALFLYHIGAHDRISVANKLESLELTKQRLRVIEKHRAWLGERAYRDRLAVYILRFISFRPERWRIIAYSIRRAGPLATMKDLGSKVFNRVTNA